MDACDGKDPDAHTGTLALPLNADFSPSVIARLIQCSYIIDVIFVADSVMVSNLHVRIPVRIYAPQPPPTVFVQQAPPGWNPQVGPLRHGFTSH